ncbi:MAG: histidine phosphatase family protein [Caulobacterales bacterium]
MKTIILMRHAKAVRDQEAPNDRARGLTGRGRRDAAAAGAALIAAGVKPEFALVSSAQRTRETAHYALAEIAPIDVRVDDDLYLADPQTIWQAAMAAPAGRVLVIAHNPGIHEIAAMLADQAGDRSNAARAAAASFPTSAFAAFEIENDILTASGARFLAGWRPEKSED